MLKKGYDATGVVAVACARHGCFAPGSVVDMQKGERCVYPRFLLHIILMVVHARLQSS